MKANSASLRPGRKCVMAMVLGTALAALGPGQGQAAESSGRAIQDMSRYCTACWRNARLPADRWGDCTQEVFRRLLERVPADGWNEVLARDNEPRREFLRAIDAVKKQSQRERRSSAYQEDLAVDTRDSADCRLREDREALNWAASMVLSARQHRILQLTAEGWPIADIARAQGISCERISDEKYKAIHKLRRFFQADV